VKNALKGLAILLCGMFIGSALTAHWGHHLMVKLVGNPQRMAEHLTRRLTHELDLSPQQTEQVHAILAKRAETASQIFREIHPRLSEQFDLMHDEISLVLDDDQKTKWDRHYEKMKKRFEERAPGK
jgi:hypothetical protein